MGETYLIPGVVTRGVWCEIHALPHAFEYSMYSYSEPASGYLNISLVREVRRCDVR